MTNFSDKWDKKEKLPSCYHVRDFPGTKESIMKLLQVLENYHNEEVTIEQLYVNPTHYVVVTNKRSSGIKVYLDGEFVNPKL